jgi:hypothetical protein
MAYETTTVSVEKSQGAIRALLVGYGASAFACGEEIRGDVRLVGVHFVIHGRGVRMRVPLRPISEKEATRRARVLKKSAARAIAERDEDEARRIWRVLHWNLKARMEAVQEGVETFEEAFLAHLLDERTGETIYETLARQGSIDLGQPLLQIEASTP